MPLSLPPWASGSNALTKFTFSTEIGNKKKMPAAVVKAPDLQVNGVRLLWAAITSGRPPAIVPTVFDSSNAAYRQWRIWASLGLVEPDGSGGLRRTATFSDLDPTEKGHLNYALAGALTKAYTGAKLASPWLAHLSLAEKANYKIQYKPGVKSRPDYLGVTYGGAFIIGEAKGRMYVNAGLKGQLNGKRQTGVVTGITSPTSASAPTAASPVARYGIAAATGGASIKLFATDPPDEVRGLPDPNDWIRAYYRFLIQLAELVNDDGFDVAGPFNGTEGGNWQRVRFVVPEMARRWADGHGSPLQDFQDDTQQFLDAMARQIPILGTVNPDLTYFRAS